MTSDWRTNPLPLGIHSTIVKVDYKLPIIRGDLSAVVNLTKKIDLNCGQVGGEPWARVSGYALPLISILHVTRLPVAKWPGTGYRSQTIWFLFQPHLHCYVAFHEFREF